MEKSAGVVKGIKAYRDYRKSYSQWKKLKPLTRKGGATGEQILVREEQISKAKNVALQSNIKMRSEFGLKLKPVVDPHIPKPKIKKPPQSKGVSKNTALVIGGASLYAGTKFNNNPKPQMYKISKKEENNTMTYYNALYKLAAPLKSVISIEKATTHSNIKAQASGRKNKFDAKPDMVEGNEEATHLQLKEYKASGKPGGIVTSFTGSTHVNKPVREAGNIVLGSIGEGSYTVQAIQRVCGPNELGVNKTAKVSDTAAIKKRTVTNESMSGLGYKKVTFNKYTKADDSLQSKNEKNLEGLGNKAKTVTTTGKTLVGGTLGGALGGVLTSNVAKFKGVKKLRPVVATGAAVGALLGGVATIPSSKKNNKRIDRKIDIVKQRYRIGRATKRDQLIKNKGKFNFYVKER